MRGQHGPDESVRAQPRAILETLVVYLRCIEKGSWRLGLCRIAHGNQAEWLHVVWNAQDLPHPALTFGFWVQCDPHCAQIKGSRRQKQIGRRCCTVFNPVPGSAWLPADSDHDRCVYGHARPGVHIAQGLTRCGLAHYDEFPWPPIGCRRGGHGCFYQRPDLLIAHGMRGKLADASSCLYDIECPIHVL